MNIKETTLGANQWLEDNQRLQYKTGKNMDSLMQPDATPDDPDDGPKEFIAKADDLDDFVVALRPMQIRTFVVNMRLKA